MITVYVVVKISCIDELSFGPVLVLDGLEWDRLGCVGCVTRLGSA